MANREREEGARFEALRVEAEAQRIQRDREWREKSVQLEEEKKSVASEQQRIEAMRYRIEEDKRVASERMQQVDILLQEAKRDRKFLELEKQVRETMNMRIEQMLIIVIMKKFAIAKQDLDKMSEEVQQREATMAIQTREMIKKEKESESEAKSRNEKHVKEAQRIEELRSIITRDHVALKVLINISNY